MHCLGDKIYTELVSFWRYEGKDTCFNVWELIIFANCIFFVAAPSPKVTAVPKERDRCYCLRQPKDCLEHMLGSVQERGYLLRYFSTYPSLIVLLYDIHW